MWALKWTGYLGALLLAIVLVAAIIVFITPAGVGLAVNVATRFAPGLAIRKASGSLIDDICVEELDYRNSSLALQAKYVCVNVNIWQSLDTLELSLKTLRAASITIDKVANAPPSDPTRGYAPDLPLSITLGTAKVDQFRYGELVLTAIAGSSSLGPRDLKLDVSLDYANYSFDIQASGSWESLQLDAALWIPEQLSLSGQLDLTRPELPYKASLRGPALDLTPWTGRALQLQAPQLTLEGDLQNYRFTLETMATDTAVGHARVTAAGSGDDSGITLNAQMALSPNSVFVGDFEKLNLSGQINWAPELHFVLQADTEAVTVNSPGVDVTLGGELALAGSPSDININAQSLHGSLNNFPLQGNAALRWTDNTAVIELVELQLGEGQLLMSGQVQADASTQLTARSTALPLAAIDSRLRGDVTGELTLTNYPQQPEITLSVQTDNAGFNTFDSKTLSVDYQGTLNGGSLRSTLETELGVVDGRFQVKLLNDILDADISDLNISYTEQTIGESIRLALRTPTHLKYSAGSITLDETCFDAYHSSNPDVPANTCLTLQYPQGPAIVSIADIALPFINLPSGKIGVQATLNAQARIDSFEHPQGTAQLNLVGLVAHLDDMSREFGDLQLNLQMDEQQASVKISSPTEQALVSDGEIRAKLASPFLQSELRGALRVRIDGIRLVREFLPPSLAYEVSNLSGALALEAQLAGTLENPLIDGKVTARNAGWLLNVSGSHFSAVEMTAELEDSSNLDLMINGGLGEGSFKIEGTLKELGADTARLATNVSFSDARILELPDYTATLSGELDLSMTPDSINLTGTLAMPSARIVVAELPETAIAISSDTVIVGAEEAAPTQQLRTTKVQLQLGKDVHLSAFGLDTRLRGSLTLIETPGKPPDLRGLVTLRDGTFEAYGQKLKVDRGELTFLGPVDDPVINLTASKLIERSSGDVTVFIVLSGSAKNIETEVRADPALPEGDALALLLTGRTLAEMTSGEQTNVYGAAIALGLYGASGVTRSLAATMGLEEIIVGQDQQGAWEVGAAVRLQQNLYLRYTYGVFSRLGGVLLRYRLSERVSVQAKAGDTQSIEVRYGVD